MIIVILIILIIYIYTYVRLTIFREACAQLVSSSGRFALSGPLRWLQLDDSSEMLTTPLTFVDSPKRSKLDIYQNAQTRKAQNFMNSASEPRTSIGVLRASKNEQLGAGHPDLPQIAPEKLASTWGNCRRKAGSPCWANVRSRAGRGAAID